MELGALVVTRGSDLKQSGESTRFWSSAWPVVGKTVLERWVERVRDLGVGMVSVVDRGVQPPARILDWAKDGVERILLIVSGAYAEVDLTDLISFHSECRNKITRVFDKEGPLGISLLDRNVLLKRRGAGEECNLSSRYDFSGYVSRLSSTLAYRQLVQDALEGRCGIQPAGLQADEKVWIDPTAHVDPSARIHGPCYVGANSRLNAGVVVTGYSSIERSCEIDIGTKLDHACVLPYTYLSAGLHVRNSVVDGTRLEHLEHGVTVDLEATGLAKRIRLADGPTTLGQLGQRAGLWNTSSGAASPSESGDFPHEA